MAGENLDHDLAVRRYFRGAAERHSLAYDERTRAGYIYTRRRDLVGQVLDRLDGGDLLDVGCASAPLEPVCVAAGFRYCGIDISSEMVAAARTALPSGSGSHIATGRVEHLGFADESFDVVLALGVLEYVDESVFDVAMTEIHRVLRPGGTVVVTVMNGSSAIWRLRRGVEELRRSAVRWRRRAHVTAAPERLFSSEELVGRLHSAGSVVEVASPYAFVIVPARIYAWRPRFWASVARRLERNPGRVIGRQALGHLLVAVKPPVERPGSERSPVVRAPSSFTPVGEPARTARRARPAFSRSPSLPIRRSPAGRTTR